MKREKKERARRDDRLVRHNHKAREERKSKKYRDRFYGYGTDDSDE